MKQTNWIPARLMVIALALCATLAGPSAAGGTDTDIIIDEQLLQQLRNDERTSYAIIFHERPDLSAAYGMEWEQRGRYVMQTLQRAAERSQVAVRNYLGRSGAEYQHFWISNMVIVESGSRATFDGLLAFDEIAALRTVPQMSLIMPEEASMGGVRGSGVEPNISHVMAPDVWAMGYDGQGMVVGSIDSGVRYTHEALVNQYRGNLGEGVFDHGYNWWDGAGTAQAPVDTVFHGTHTIGSAVGGAGGENVIGVAPGAQWIACRGCTNTACMGTALMQCAQFMAAPWDANGDNPDPDLRAHVVNNSWGDCFRSYDGFYQEVVDTWHAAGIVPVFANGNASNCGYQYPPGCNTVGNPGRYANVLGVGSTGTDDGQYATHSNWGPTDNVWNDNPLGFASIKPNVSAPGVSIRSAVHTGDDEYGTSTGTSMSAPHVAGLVALIWQAAPCLRGDYIATSRLLMEFADDIPYASQCGGEGPGDVPNNATGWGEINAFSVVSAGVAMCGAQLIKGVVARADDGQPVADAQIRLDGPMPRTVATDADGYYEAGVMVGNYTVSAFKPGFYTAVAGGVTVQELVDTTVDLDLEPAPIAGVDPVSGLWFDLVLGEEGTAGLMLDNTGHIDLAWEIMADQLPANARETLDEVLVLDDFSLVSPAHGGQPVTLSIPAGQTGRGEVTGFSFSGAVTGIGASASWASQMCLIVQAPDGSRYEVGGSRGTYPGCGVNDWTFQGAVSAGDGQYQSTHRSVFDPAVNDLGQWTLTFVNDWNTTSAATMTWSDVTLTLHKTPPSNCTDTRGMPWLSVDPAAGSIPPGGMDSAQVMVDSAGMGVGLFESALCITTNDELATLVAVPVTVAVSAAPAGVPAVHPLTLDFGDVPAGGSVAATVTVTNATPSGSSMVTLAHHQVVAGAGFELAGGGCPAGQVLLTGQSCAIVVRFAPVDIGMAAGVLVIDIDGEPPISVGLNGSAVELTDALMFDRFER